MVDVHLLGFSNGICAFPFHRSFDGGGVQGRDIAGDQFHILVVQRPPVQPAARYRSA